MLLDIKGSERSFLRLSLKALWLLRAGRNWSLKHWLKKFSNISELFYQNNIHWLERPWIKTAYAVWGWVLAKGASLSLSLTHLSTFLWNAFFNNHLVPSAAPRWTFPSLVILILMSKNKLEAWLIYSC